MEARAADFATGTGPTIASRPSTVQTAAQIRELIDDEDLESTEDDTGASGHGKSQPPAFSRRGSRGHGFSNRWTWLIFFRPATDASLANLREISTLASWTVSTYKPGCGIAALRSSSTSQFWQSDGPQPHLLNIHFFKLVSIVKLRVYLDFELDESYTPTRMLFLAGTGMYDLTEFAEWVGEAPRGWVDVDLEGVGSGGSDVLKAMVVQVKICENHQNGKDTHVRGVQIFARDEK